jgi:hypothetical protein
MNLIARQRFASERQRRREQCHGSLLSRGVARILSDQVAQLVCQKRTHTEPSAGRDGSSLLQQATIDGNCDVVFGSHYADCAFFT